jgi:hypothetical protein
LDAPARRGVTDFGDKTDEWAGHDAHFAADRDRDLFRNNAARSIVHAEPFGLPHRLELGIRDNGRPADIGDDAVDGGKPGDEPPRIALKIEAREQVTGEQRSREPAVESTPGAPSPPPIPSAPAESEPVERLLGRVIEQFAAELHCSHHTACALLADAMARAAAIPRPTLH